MNDEKNISESSKNEASSKVIKKIGIGLLVCFVVSVIVSAVCSCVLLFNFFDYVNKKGNNKSIIFDMINDEMSNGDYKNFTDEFKKHYNEQNAENFNYDLEVYNGTKDGLEVKSFLDEVVLSNKKNSNHIISVIFNEETITDSNKIIELKMIIDDSAEYEIILDYDKNSYVNKATIKKY